MRVIGLHAPVLAAVKALAIAVCLAPLALAAPAGAASVAKLRVGQHPEFTRVVFELDRPAGYRLEERVADDGTPLLVVTLDAALGNRVPREVKSGSALLESVRILQSGQQSVATVRLRKPGLPVKELLLTGPPRIVLDLLGDDTALARAKPSPAPKPTAKPAPKPAPAPVEVAKPEPPPAPKPAPKPTAEAEPTPRPAPAPVEVAKPEPPPTDVPDTEGEGEPPQRDLDAEQAAREAMERRLAAVREAAEKRRAQLEAEKKTAEKKAEEEAEPATAGPVASLSRPVLIGAAVGLLLVVLLVAVALVRRRSLPKDVDVSAFDDAAAEPADEQDEPLIGSGIGEEMSPPASASQAEGAPSPTPPLSAPGLFEEPEKGESSMDAHASPVGGERSALRPGADLGQVIAALERRVAQLESGLQEANAARDRLERQVAAQSEELRVQRAAIARTQRALRGLSRSEEEQATEPALRE